MVPVTGQKINEDDFTASTEVPLKEDKTTKQCGEIIQSLGTRNKGSDDENLFEAEFGEFPWTMALFKRNPTDSEDLLFLCGAALLSPRVAITVIHNINRIRNISTLVLRAGEFDISSTKESIQHQDRTIQKVKHFCFYYLTFYIVYSIYMVYFNTLSQFPYPQIIKHPDYYSGSHINDLAILTWDEPLDMDNANIGVICLPGKDEIFDNQDCIATGWGKSKACE